MKKVLSLLLAVVMLLSCVPAPLFANAAEGSQKLYLKPNANWLNDNARFAIYYWNEEGSAWTDMADTDNDGYYEGEVPAGTTNVIFCRMNPGVTANDWANKWNQTSDLTVPTDGTNCYTVAEGSWDSGNGQWSAYVPEGEEPTEPEESKPVEPEEPEVPAAKEYFLYGWLNGADVAANTYKFVDGKLTITFTAADNYVFVKDSEGTDYMTDGWQGFGVTSAVLGSGFASGDKLHIPGGEYELTLTENADGTLTLDVAPAQEEEPVDPDAKVYYLYGWLNGADVNGNVHKFVNGKLEFTFEADDNYIFVKDNKGASYMTDGWMGFGITSAVLGSSFASGDKLHVPNGKYELALTENADGTLTLDVKEIQDDQPDVPVERLYTVAGTAALCGSEWSPADTNNKMSLNAEGLYEKLFINVPAGEHKFKVTNGTWNSCWGNGDDGDGNTVFTTDKEQNVLITFNAETKEITVTLIDIEPYYVAGSADLCGVGWDPGCAGNKMFLDADGLYKKVFQSVPAGTHECKITAGDWSNNWGVGGPNGANYAFTTDDVYDVTIIFNPETFEISHELSEATTPALPPAPEDYDITIKVHYYRPDGNYNNWEVHMWNGVESLSSTRKFEAEEVTYGGVTYGVTATYYADASDTWVGFIVKKPDWTKDPDGDRKVDISNVLSGTVHVYAKSGSALTDFITDKSEAVLGNKITAAVYDSIAKVLTVTTAMPVEGDLNTAFTLEGPDGEIPVTKATRVGSTNNYVLAYEGEIDPEQEYIVSFNGVSCQITIPNTYSTESFEAEYTYEGDDLGATWSAESTTFRLWAPTASAVSVNLYSTGSDNEEGAAELGSYAMTKDVNGTWIVTIQGELKGVYYTYSVTRKGETVEACDPYARATGVNGDRAMVIDLDSTDPEGWENDTYVTQANYTDAVIWELHVRDFSIDVSSGITEANRGKYLAFTERGTTIPGTDVATGVDYMVNLGINYVHLLPVYDINSVDETTGGYNWGYDPKNYNVPEGSYSTDPYNGAVRVNEFKQMVQSLHNAGIGVVMDVVYNHVADAGAFCFNQIVPGYFSRIHDDGSYQSNSGCGNDTASERAMVRKYIVDSVLYWTEEYHIDGFRWDLVGLIDYETINEVMAEVHKVNPNIMFYGEGWEMCQWTTKDEGAYASDPYSKKMTIQPNDHLVNTEAGVFAFFNDTIRNVIHGGVFTATDKGFVAGNMSAATKETVTLGYMGNSNWGSNNSSVDTPLQTINYASCHDNYTLFDNLTIDVMDATGVTAEYAACAAAEMNNLAAAYYITAQGVPFIHAGEEMLRSKPDAAQENGFNHNSYASGDEINSFKWYTLTRPLASDTLDYYTGLIAFRKAHPALRMTTEAEIQAAMSVLNTGNNNVVAVLNKGGNGEEAEILTILNADTKAHSFTLPEGEWNVYVNKTDAGTEVLATVSGTITVESTSAMILIKAVEEEQTNFVKWMSGTTSLNGTIDLNIYVALSDDLLSDPNVFVRFTHSGVTVDVPVSEGIEALKKDTVCYRYSCEIFAKQVADTVTVQVMRGEEAVGESLEYSVMTYCINQIKNSQKETTVALCKAMLNYATAAQLKFNYNTGNLANASLNDADKVLPEVDASAYKYSITGAEDGIKASSATLMLESEVKIRVYFKLTGDKSIEDYTFTIDGKEVEIQKNDKGYYIESEGIVAKQLDEMHEFCVGGITVTYGALSYVNSKLTASEETELNINLAKALYAYYVAAEALLG